MSHRPTLEYLLGATLLGLALAIEGVAQPPAPIGVPGPHLAGLCSPQPAGGVLDVVIPDDGTVYEIHDNATCGLITIEGTLRCADGVNAVVKMDGMLIAGDHATLECGTASNRFTGKVTFTLQHDRAFAMHPDHGERAIIVMQGGTLDLHGQLAKTRFSRLNQDAQAGAMSLVTPGLSGWEPGDRIIVTTTSTYPEQTEFLTLQDSCPNGVCGITTGLEFFHFGSAARDYPGAGKNGTTLSVDMRAYVANVERNITIRGASDAPWTGTDPKGGHLMIMQGGTARIDAVAFNRMGQQKILGRYPVHWHHAGNVEGQYLRNSSVRNSPSRCVALHNTHRAEVSNNLCYDIAGHAMFLENGNEIENTLRGNLIVDVRRPPENTQLLQSDVDVERSRWRGPAGFWVTNGNNTIESNVVVNAGTGYWHAFIEKLQCYDDPSNVVGTRNAVYGRHCDYVLPSEEDDNLWNVEPIHSPTLSYAGNIAIATRVGHTWDGAPDGALVNPPHIQPPNPFDRVPNVTAYDPGSPQTFDGMHAYKQGRTGIYFRGINNSALIENAVVAEAPTGWFGTGNQEIADSVFVGISHNFRGVEDADEDFFYHLDGDVPDDDHAGIGGPHRGWGLYDGANYFRHVTFDYPSAPLLPGGRENTPTPITRFGRAHFANHLMVDLRFVNDPYRRVSYGEDTNGIQWKDVLVSESSYDIDGSVFGAPGFLRPHIPFNELAGDCATHLNNAHGANPNQPSRVLRCQTHTQSIKIQIATPSAMADKQVFNVTRMDTMETVGNSDPDEAFTKFQVYADTPTVIDYRVEQLDLRGNATLNLIWIETLDLGDWTPPIIIDSSAVNPAPNCSSPAAYVLENWPSFPTLPVHRATTEAEARTFSDRGFSAVYYQDTASNSLLLRLRATELLRGGPFLAVQNKAEGRFNLVCP